jgi:uncharacterized protein (TIGR00369 family)
MSKLASDPFAAVKQSWERFSSLPGGKLLFSKAIGLLAAYSGTIDARVDEMRPGYARAHMADRRKLRNHLKSIHAIALANLAELTGSLALIASMPSDARVIVTGLSIDYLKKARGKISAVAEAPDIKSSERKELAIDIRLEDKSGEVVSKAQLKCLLGPKRKS